MSERPVMDAIHIRLIAADIENEDWRGEECCIWLKSITLTRAIRGFGAANGPVAATQGTRTRFRVALTVAGSPELAGVYFVGGWTDNGLVFLDRDQVQEFVIPRRREAVLATRAKHAAKVEKRVHG